MAYERGHIRTDSGRFIDKGNQVFDVTHPDFAGGAKGDGVTDDTEAINTAIREADEAGAVLFFPDGHYLTDGITIPSAGFRMRGNSRRAILECTGAGYLIQVIEKSDVEISGFSFLAPTGGVLLQLAHGTKLKNLWAGFGSGGKFIHNRGSMLCDFTRCIASTNRSQIASGSAGKPDYAFYLESGQRASDGAWFPHNMCVLTGCMGEGMAVGGLYASNSLSQLYQGYTKCVGCTFEGNGSADPATGFDVRLQDTFGFSFSTSHVEGVTVASNVILDGAAGTSWYGGIVGTLLLTGNCWNNTFEGAVIVNADIEPTAHDTFFRSCLLKWSNGTFRDASVSTYTDGSSFTDWNTNKSFKYVADRTRSPGEAINVNGAFYRWSGGATVAPDGYTLTGGATILRSTTRHSFEYAAQLTAVGTTDMQGLRCDFQAGLYLTNPGFVTVAFWARRPAASAAAKLKVRFNQGFSLDAAVLTEELPADTWVYIRKTFAFGTSGNPACYATIGFDTPAGGEVVYLDDLSIVAGAAAPEYFQPHAGRAIEQELGAERRRITTGAAAPTAGSYRAGDLVYNTAPVAGGTVGWVCVAAGTPGTWKTFGSISA